MTGQPRRGCATCGRVFTVPANNPHRRYCAPRCRVADWRHRHHPDPADRTGDTANGANAVTNAANVVTAGTGATADPRCPHCHQPVTVISLLIPPAAAHVPTPTPPDA